MPVLSNLWKKQILLRFNLSKVQNKQGSLRFNLYKCWNKHVRFTFDIENEVKIEASFRLRFDIVAITTMVFGTDCDQDRIT